jgi:hypothetical protein
MPPSPWPEAEAGSRLHTGLATWARACPLPIVLFLDEIDALRGQSLISVLRQLRDGFRSRPDRSLPPWCCAGCGTYATTRRSPAATLRGLGPRARSTSRSSRSGCGTSRKTRWPNCTGSGRGDRLMALAANFELDRLPLHRRFAVGVGGGWRDSRGEWPGPGDHPPVCLTQRNVGT